MVARAEGTGRMEGMGLMGLDMAEAMRGECRSCAVW
jgi:hypothetical protein